VTDPEIADILGKYSDITTAAAKLIEKANENGGPDNVTCVVVRWTQ
jgi:serine/threonine protein phosphatase PrpC